MNETATVQLPPALRAWLSTVTEDNVITNHQIAINRSWWTRQLAAYGFDDTLVGSTLTRGELFELADGAREAPEGAVTLLWNTLAWGVGTRPRNVKGRIAAVADRRDYFGRLLQEAAQLSLTDPVGAYTLMRPTKYRNAITWLGPAFFTKFLYFAGGGAPLHPCCILDDRVARTLRNAGWSDLANGSWSGQTYGAYSGLIHQWRQDTASARNDLIERWLFNAGGDTTYGDSDGVDETVFSPDELRDIHYWLWLAADVYPDSEAPNDYSRIKPRLTKLLEGDLWGEVDGRWEPNSNAHVQPSPADDVPGWVAAHRQELLALVSSAPSRAAAVKMLAEKHSVSASFAAQCVQQPIWHLVGNSTGDRVQQGDS